jgi:hypothetical protein
MNLVDQKLLDKSSLDLYPGFQFWTIYRPQNVPSTYMRIDLYASIYGSSKFNNTKMISGGKISGTPWHFVKKNPLASKTVIIGITVHL